MGLPRGKEWSAKAALSTCSWYLRRRRIHRPEIAATLLEDVKEHSPDLITMTGDLINFGSEAEFRNGAGFLQKLCKPEALLCLPGNHEAMTHRSMDYMRTHWSAIQGVSEKEQFPVLRVFGNCALITVSTAIPTPLGFASGEVGESQRELLAQILGQVRADGLLAIVLMHHPPTKITSSRKRLIDGPEVCELFAEYGVALVLHGHTHARELSWIDGKTKRIPVVGIGSLSTHPARGHKRPGAWQMVEIFADDGSVILSERQITRGGSVAGMTPMRFDLR